MIKPDKSEGLVQVNYAKHLRNIRCLVLVESQLTYFEGLRDEMSPHEENYEEIVNTIKQLEEALM